jgi:hypothetical protein
MTKQIASDERVPTGALQFGDDWPGVFIRGDEAMAYASIVRRVAPELCGLVSLLESCKAEA